MRLRPILRERLILIGLDAGEVWKTLGKADLVCWTTNPSVGLRCTWKHLSFGLMSDSEKKRLASISISDRYFEHSNPIAWSYRIAWSEPKLDFRLEVALF